MVQGRLDVSKTGAATTMRQQQHRHKQRRKTHGRSLDARKYIHLYVHLPEPPLSKNLSIHTEARQRYSLGGRYWCMSGGGYWCMPGIGGGALMGALYCCGWPADISRQQLERETTNHKPQNLFHPPGGPVGQQLACMWQLREVRESVQWSVE